MHEKGIQIGTTGNGVPIVWELPSPDSVPPEHLIRLPDIDVLPAREIMGNPITAMTNRTMRRLLERAGLADTHGVEAVEAAASLAIAHTTAKVVPMQDPTNVRRMRTYWKK